MSGARTILSQYAATVLVNVVSVGASLVQATLVPRALGPASYGSFSFMLHTAGSLRGAINLSVSNAFFTHNSKTRRSATLAAMFVLWHAANLLALLGFALASFALGFGDVAFPDQAVEFVAVMILLEWLLTSSVLLTQFGESKGLNVKAQFANLLGVFAQTTAVVVLSLSDTLGLESFVAIRFCYAILVSTCLAAIIYRKRGEILGPIVREKVRGLIRYCVRFCSPLVSLTVFGMGAQLFDRWFLQLVSGSIQQGHFSLALKWRNVLAIASGSLQPLLWREVAKSYSAGDRGRTRRITLAAFSGVFYATLLGALPVIFYAEEILLLVAGPEFVEGKLSLMLMMAVAPFVVLSQFSTCCFYAMEAVRIHRNLGIFSITLKLLASYLLLAPATFWLPGFGLGSVGLAAQHLSTTLLMANVHVYFLSRISGVPFRSILRNEVTGLLLLGVLALGAYELANGLLDTTLPRLVLMTSLLVLGAGLAGVARPALVGLTRKDLSLIWDWAVARILRKKAPRS